MLKTKLTLHAVVGIFSICAILVNSAAVAVGRFDSLSDNAALLSVRGGQGGPGGGTSVECNGTISFSICRIDTTCGGKNFDDCFLQINSLCQLCDSNAQNHIVNYQQAGNVNIEDAEQSTDGCGVQLDNVFEVGCTWTNDVCKCLADRNTGDYCPQQLANIYNYDCLPE